MMGSEFFETKMSPKVFDALLKSADFFPAGITSNTEFHGVTVCQYFRDAKGKMLMRGVMFSGSATVAVSINREFLESCKKPGLTEKTILEAAQ